MRDWVELPDALTPDARRTWPRSFRRLKDHSGLISTALAGQTFVQQVLLGALLQRQGAAPRQAALALGELRRRRAGTADRSVGRRHEIAWKQRGAAERAAATAPVDSVDDEPRSTPAPVARPSRPASHRRGRVAIAAASLLACAGAGVFVALDQGSGPRDRNSRDIAASSPTRQLETSCFSDSCTAKDPKQTGCAGDAWTAALPPGWCVRGTAVQRRLQSRVGADRVGTPRRRRAGRRRPRPRTLQAKVHYDTDVYTAMTVAMTRPESGPAPP